MRRARHYIKQTINNSVANRSIRDTKDDPGLGHETVAIPVKGITEPRFVHSSVGGLRQEIFSGNKDFVSGDRIPRPGPKNNQTKSNASEDGERQDNFSFAFTGNEYLDILFEGLEPPDLSKKQLSKQETVSLHRGGITTYGSPSSLNLARSMRHSLGRRITLQRPSAAEINRLQAQMLQLEKAKNLTANLLDELKKLRQWL